MATLSQWTMKRICKFFIKRLLGTVLRAELDLEQLEVQLGSGRIQLRDLALNTDYINDQLGNSSVILREGSIGSVSAKIPWNPLGAEAVEIEVDELELVFIPRPCAQTDRGASGFTGNEGRDGDVQQSAAAAEGDAGGAGGSAGGAYVGVDDGVRTIATMVERLLLGLRVRVKNLIAVFQNPPPVTDPKEESWSHGMLVVRVAYLDYGVQEPACQQEQPRSGGSGGVEPSMLVKVFSFKGASVELMDLNVSPTEAGEFPSSSQGASAADIGAVQGQSVPVVCGEDGGVCGTLQLSIPKSSVPDLPKVDVVVQIGSVKVKAATREIQQLLSLAQNYSQSGTVAAGPRHSVSRATQGAVSFYEAPIGRGSGILAAEKHKDLARSTLRRSGSIGVGSPDEGAYLPVTKFISDWMQWAGGENPKKGISVAEANLAASVDEFFECFDGTWSSHASSTASGLWSWTRSAFTAITAASSLASGSAVLSPGLERQVEYSVKVTFDGLSVNLFYGHPDARSPGMPESESATHDSSLHGLRSQRVSRDKLNVAAEEYLAVDFTECALLMAVSDCRSDLRITVQDMEMFEVVNAGCSSPGRLDFLKSAEDLLPHFPVSLSPHEGVLSHGCERRLLMKVGTVGSPAAKLSFKLLHPGDNTFSQDLSPSVEVKAYLQPIVLYLDPWTIKRIFELTQAVKGPSCSSRGCGTVQRSGDGASVLVPRIDQMLALDSGEGGSLATDHAAGSPENNLWNAKLEGSLYTPCLRVLICFPKGSEVGHLRDHLVVLDVTMPARKPGVIQPMFSFRHDGTRRIESSSQLVDSGVVRFGEAVAYLLGSDEVDFKCSEEGHEAGSQVRLPVVRMNQLAVLSEPTDWEGGISSTDTDDGASLEFKWFRQTETGAWLARRAWDAAIALRKTVDGGTGLGVSNSEYASATAAEAGEESNLQLRAEIVACSSAVFAFKFFRVWLNLSGSQHVLIQELFSSFMDVVLSSENPQARTATGVSINSDSTVGQAGANSFLSSQTSIVLECGHVEMIMHPCHEIVPHEEPFTGHEARNWDSLTWEVEQLELLSVSHMGGRPDVSYFWIQHEECQVKGSYPDAHRTMLTGESDLLLFSCRHDALGRGGGGKGNALAAGAAGISLTYMAWPGRDQLADELLTGCMKGATFVAHSARLDWLSTMISFFSQSAQFPGAAEAVVDIGAGTGADQNPSVENSSGFQDAKRNRVFHLFNLHDVALCYEPGMEVRLVPGTKVSPLASPQFVKTAGGSKGSDIPLGANQTGSPVACVLAAAAVRISNTLQPDMCESQYDIRLYDVALLILNTNMRKRLQEYSLEAIERTGYAQVAKAPILAVAVRTGCVKGPGWEVDCVNNNLDFETCNDTASALARLVAQLQQLFAPDLQQADFSRRAEEEVCSSPKFDEMMSQENVPDLHQPHTLAEGQPIFIEDYYSIGASSTAGSSCGDESVGGSFHEGVEGEGMWFDGNAITIIENHIPDVKVAEPRTSKAAGRRKHSLPKKYPVPVGRVVLTNFSANWKLYAGSDWPSAMAHETSRSSKAKNARKARLCLEVDLKGMDLQYDSFPEVGEYASRLVVELEDMGIYDVSADAPWKKVLGYHRSSRPRESFSRAVKVELESVRPDPASPLEEYRISVALLPIRLHLDQRHIDFFTDFFSSQSEGDMSNSSGSVSTSLDCGLSEVFEEALLPFFQVCDLRPFTISVDYRPRRVDIAAIRGGNYAELLNLVNWKGIELQLKHVRAANVRGWSSLSGIIFGQWLEDISHNQYHKLVQGVGPIRPLFAVGAGAAKLIMFPAENYMKDRRVLRGMRKGAMAFLRCVSVEALGLGANLFAGAHDVLYHTELALGGTRSSSLTTADGDNFSSKVNQPSDTREGIQQACESISRGLERTSSSLLSNPLKVYQRGAGAGVAVASALRAAPAAAVAPAAAAVGAFHCALLGVRNGLDPEHKREADEKHAGPPYMYQ